MDPEKTVGLESTCSTAAAVDNNEPYTAHHEDDDVPLELANFTELKPSNTVLSTRSAREAARALDDFDDAPENPRNWPNGQRWRTTLTVAVTGFISTTGSSVAVPGIRAVMAEFGEPNEKVGVLVTACYVLGLVSVGWFGWCFGTQYADTPTQQGAGPFVFAPLSELYGRQTGECRDTEQRLSSADGLRLSIPHITGSLRALLSWHSCGQQHGGPHHLALPLRRVRVRRASSGSRDLLGRECGVVLPTYPRWW